MDDTITWNLCQTTISSPKSDGDEQVNGSARMLCPARHLRV